MMRTGNPVLSAKAWSQFATDADRPTAMTVQGTVNKTAVLLALVLLPAAVTWHWAATRPEVILPWMWGGLIAGLVLALVTIFKKTWAPVTAPLYALAEGVFLGAISSLFNQVYPGIVVQAVALTFGVCFCMLAIYKMRIIRATERFKMGVVSATGAIFLVYMVTIGLGLFGVRVPYIHGSGLIGIGFSLVVVVIASLNLVLDFDFIEKGAAAGAPKYMEWYGAFGLMVTLIWLYLELLRLLAKLNSRR